MIILCEHEQDIDYGKHIEITPTLQAVHMLCTGCGSVGTVIEELLDKDEPDHWTAKSEIWHEPKDYYRADIAEHMEIKMTYKGEQ